MNSTLVETVSINYEDFNESFLTCGTCLCVYDGSEHIPKLLQCSHTVCLQCLKRISESQSRDSGTFRCPICRELITIPGGGVPAFPPSFLVNQLLDLMARQRRDVVPKCSVHLNQELLFCETCDTVFCTMCVDTSPHHRHPTTSLGASSLASNSSSNSCEHTVIPFSIAIKRMSEILLYKANECVTKLGEAQEEVSAELGRLDEAKERCMEHINNTFEQMHALINVKKEETVQQLDTVYDQKRKVLDDQNNLIECEKNKVQEECDGLQYQIEVRNITQRIENLSKKLDKASNLSEPRENAFLQCHFVPVTEQFEALLQNMARIGTSTTFPSLCKLENGSRYRNEPLTAHIECEFMLYTVDYHGAARQSGGDPVTAYLSTRQSSVSISNVPMSVQDCDNGTYRIRFRPNKAGQFSVRVQIFDRPIQNSPFEIEVSEHNNPVSVFGRCGGLGASLRDWEDFMQPVCVAVASHDDGSIYVMDTGNSRLKVLSKQFVFQRHLYNAELEGRSCTGMSISRMGHSLVVVNWRTRRIIEMSMMDGVTLNWFSCNEFKEPVDVAVDRDCGRVIVADAGSDSVFVFNSMEDGSILFKIVRNFRLLAAVAVSKCGYIVVAAGRALQIFSSCGDFQREICDNSKEHSGSGQYGGVAIDSENRILASRLERKGRNVVQVLSIDDEKLNVNIDSHESKLKRPCGLAVTNDHHVIVVDCGNNCIKKYRYW